MNSHFCACMCLCSSFYCFITQIFGYFSETFLPAENYTLHHTTLNIDNTDTHIVTQCKPVPKKRLLLYSCKNSSLDTAISDNGVKQVVTPAPRGILKHNISSCSSADSLHLHIPTSDDSSSSSQSSATVSPISPETPISPPLSPYSVHTASGWLDRKQVRFSSVVAPIERVKGEHSVLEEDWSPLSEQDRSYITDNGNMVVSTKSTQKDSSPWKWKLFYTLSCCSKHVFGLLSSEKTKIRYFELPLINNIGPHWHSLCGQKKKTKTFFKISSIFHRRKSNRFGMTCGWINDDQFWVSIFNLVELSHLSRELA